MVTPLTRKMARDVRRHRAQFIAVVITIFLGVALYAASYDSFQNLQTSYETTFEEFRFANLTVSGGDVASVGSHATANPGVEAAQLRTVGDIPIAVGDVKLLGRVVGLPQTGQPQVNQVKVLEGSYLDAAEEGDVLVEQHMADHFDLRVGDSIEVLDGTTWLAVEVAGIISSPEYIWPARSRQEIFAAPDDFGVVFAAESLAQDLVGEGPNELVVYYRGGAENPDLTSSLSARARDAGALEVYPRSEQPSNAGLSEDIKGFQEWSVFFPVLFLVAAAMAAYVMISRLVHSQRPQIGVLVANGFTRGQVLRHYVGYGVWPGLVGAVPGAIAGILLARVITSLYTSMLSVPVTVIQFYPATLVGGIAIGLVASLLAAIAPALVAHRVAPAAAMRGETQTGRGRRSIAERLLPPLRRLPVGWRMTLRGIERNPRRTTYTIIGVVLSLVLVLVSWGMIDTTRHLLHRQFVEIQRQDATVHFAAPTSTVDIDALGRVPGVAAVEPFVEVPVSLSVGDRHYDTLLNVLPEGTSMHRFFSTDGSEIELPAAGLLGGKSLRAELGVDPGDTVTVAVGDRGGVIDLTLVDLVDEPLGTKAYASRSYVERMLGSRLPATSALITYEPGAEYADIRAALTDLPQVAAFQDAKAIYNLMQSFMTLFYVFVGVMLTFGAAMAFSLIFNSMSVNIAERRREVATLLAVGTRRRSISRFIAAENMLVALIATPLGLVAGYVTARAAMASFNSDLFSFDLYIEPATYLWSAVAMLAVALLSQWPGLRAIRRISISQVVKERSV